jgi:hypothetical protein
MKLRLGVGFATRSSQARRPKHGLRIITSPIASCFAFRNLPRSARPHLSRYKRDGRARLPCPLHLQVRTRRARTTHDEGLADTAPHARCLGDLDRRRREHRGGRRGESPARSKSGRTPALPPRVPAVCAPCVRDEARTPHPCPSPPNTFRPGSAAPPPTVFGRHPMRPKLRPGGLMAWLIATPSSLRPVQNASRRARRQGRIPRSGLEVSR